MRSFFEKRDPWGHGLALWVLAGMAFLVPPAWWALRQIDLENNVGNWLPSDDPHARTLRWYTRHFPAEDRVLISWKGSSLDDPRVERLARRLEGTPDAEGIRRGGVPYVEHVVVPQEVIARMTGHGVPPEEAAARLQGVLIGRGDSGSPVGLLASLSEAGDAEKQAALQAIRNAAADVGIPPGDLHLGGRPVAGSELNQAVKKAAWNPAYPWRHLHKRSPLLLSGLVAVVLAFAMLRSFRMAAVVLAATFYTTYLTVALVPVTGGSMNMVLVVMPTLLMVLTLSAAIHVANYWKHAAHRNPRTALVEAAKMARQPCAMASFTTAVGLVSLTTSPLRPVRDFGAYAAVGCLLALVVVLYGLPSLLQFWPARSPKQAEIDSAFWRRLGGLLSRYRTAVTVGTLAVFLACSYGLTRFQTETKVIRYFDEDARVVEDYRFLEENLAGIVPVETIIRFDADSQKRLNFLQRMEVVREVQRRIGRHPEISGTLSLADFQPDYQPLPETASTMQQMLHNKKVSQVEKRAKEESRAAAAFLAVTGESHDLHEPGDNRLGKTGEELWRITAQVAILTDLDYADLTAELDETAASTLKEHAGAGHVVTGMVPLFLRTQQAVLESLIRSFGLAFCVIGVVMVILLRNPLAGALTMLPNLLPIGVVFGLISWGGMAVDIGTMITASVALGIAVDGTLHLLIWFRHGIRGGMSRRLAVSHALAHAGPALWQTSAAVGLGLLMLSGADLLLVSRFGWLMAALIGTALLADLVFLPALLAGPLGLLIARTVVEQKTADDWFSRPERRLERAEGVAAPHGPLAEPVSTAHSLTVTAEYE